LKKEPGEKVRGEQPQRLIVSGLRDQQENQNPIMRNVQIREQKKNLLLNVGHSIKSLMNILPVVLILREGQMM